MAAWLDRQLPEGTRIVCSPARRCEQTVLALGRKYKLRTELAPDTTPDALLAAAGWPNGKSVVLMVGHQPSLGPVDLAAAGPAAGQLPGAQGRGVVDPHARARRRRADGGGDGAVAGTALKAWTAGVSAARAARRRQPVFCQASASSRSRCADCGKSRPAQPARQATLKRPARGAPSAAPAAPGRAAHGTGSPPAAAPAAATRRSSSSSERLQLAQLAAVAQHQLAQAVHLV